MRGGLDPADARINPVKRRSGEDRRERSLGKIEVLEATEVEANRGTRANTPLGELDHARARIDRVDLETERREQLGQLAGAAPDLEHTRPGRQTTPSDRPLYQLDRVPGPHPIVGLGDAVEHLPKLLPRTLRRHSFTLRAPHIPLPRAHASADTRMDQMRKSPSIRSDSHLTQRRELSVHRYLAATSTRPSGHVASRRPPPLGSALRLGRGPGSARDAHEGRASLPGVDSGV